ncbi:ABC transporter ATP-binding protein [Dactylosporangium sp. CA-233914]|uniref:ABC transporter ATP-binding protein n=1 Tax=Dactylosporangium sp. CA-233914 TaxID=3239934 RepID=UPI003D904BB3
MNAVELQNLSYAYGSLRAVEDVTLTVEAGEVVAVLGPNGAGKSTTLLMLLGLLPPRTGTVRLFGDSPRTAVAAGRVAAMPQAGGLLPRSTVGDLLRFLHEVYPHPMPVAEALGLADLTGLAGRTVERLSGGQAQRLRFAMALVGRPDLLILDEPTAALDVESRRAFWAAMRRYADQGRTVLFSTHYLQEADANADRIVVLDRGRVIADGTAAEVKRRVGVRTVSVAAQEHDYSVLPGVAAVEHLPERVVMTSTDSDATVLALAAAGLLRDLEVAGAGLEEAYLTLTRLTNSEA